MTSLSFWGSIASILLVLEIAVVVTAAGAVVFLALKGVSWLSVNLPSYARQVLGYLQRVSSWVARICRWIALPFTAARSVWAGIRRAGQVLRGA